MKQKMRLINRKKNMSLYVGFFNLIMIALLELHFGYNWYNTYNDMLRISFRDKGNILMLSTIFLLIVISMNMWGGFKLGYTKLVTLILSQFFAYVTIGIGEFLIIALTVGTITHLSNLIKIIIITLIIDFLLTVVYDLIGIRIYLMIFPPINILQINGDYDNHLSTRITDRSDKYKICEEVSIHEDIDILYSKINKTEGVLLNDVPTNIRKQLLKYCFEHDIPVYYTPKIQDIIVRGSEEINLFDSPLFLAKNVGMTTEQAFVKRVLDIIFSSLGLVILSPLFLIIAILIKLEDGGDIFFEQERCTYCGKVFRIHKFRSMKMDAEKDRKPQPVTSNDNRITKIGRFIRTTHIDELPQLIDIWVGNMSLVGPRPERVEHVAKYTRDIPEFIYRQKVKGGLTGYAQVYGKYNTTPYDKLKMDLIYITNYSLLLDMQILLETVKIIFSKESTEGFTEKDSQEMNEYWKTHDY